MSVRIRQGPLKSNTKETMPTDKKTETETEAKAPKAKAPKAAKERETGIFASHRPPRGSRQVVGAARMSADGQPVKELRCRCIRDGSIRSFILDGYGEDGSANQATAQAVRNISSVDEDLLPVFFVDKGVDERLKVKGLPAGLIVPVINAEILEKMELNLASRAELSRSQDAIVASTLEKAK